ncbi:MAG: enolase [Patescibacteria group bacterium]|nr:MAG: enolase [Patescibacteria group bacterium]
MRIKNIFAFQILDSRGNPTIKTIIELANGAKAWAAVPSGASTGSFEALELRDGGSVFAGKGVLKAVDNVNTVLKKALLGYDIQDLEGIDKKMLELDGTENKSNLGANAILSVSLACAKALSVFGNQPLWKILHQYYFSDYQLGFPRLLVNVINGGAHAGFNFDFQEFIIIPLKNDLKQDLRLAVEVFAQLKKKLSEKKLSTLVGDEGGFSPELESNRSAYELIIAAASDLGYQNNRDFRLGMDAAATEFFESGVYTLRKEGKTLTSQQLMKFYSDLINEFNLYSFEDPFAETDWQAFAEFTKEFNDRVVIGDDLFTTNISRIQQGIEKKSANAVLIKPNQIGTLYETVQAIKKAKSVGWQIAISHRSGETEDTFIADLSVACSAEFIKTGSVCRGERTAKYNRLLEIYEVERDF